MIQPNELRIGNYVLFEGNLTELTIWHFATYLDTNPALFNPIPLTEEWLLKFRFEIERIDKFDSNTSDGTVYRIGDFLIAKYEDKWHYTYYGQDAMGRYGFCQYTKMFNELKYVHKLQNIYFETEDKELELKRK